MSNDTLFKFHKLNHEGIEKANRIQRGFTEFLKDIEEIVPAGRELAIVRTKLEEACFFAKKGMAVMPENQELPK